MITPVRNGIAGNPLEFRQVHEIRLNSSFKDNTSTAEVTIPRNIALFDNQSVREVFKRGDLVDIQFGYDNDMQHTFSGYISTVSADAPVIIKCEDEMMNLRRMAVNYSSRRTNLQELFEAIAPGYKIDALEGVTLGSIRFSKTNFGAVIDKLQSEFSLYTYMNGKTIVCGKYYADDTQYPVIDIDLDRGVKSNGLEYRYADDLLIKIKGTSIDPKGNKIESTYGDNGGDELALSYYNIPTKVELDRLIKIDYDKRKVNGFSGTLDTYGLPFVTHGRKLRFTSKMYPERNGTYYCDSYSKVFGQSGITQTLTIGNMA